MVALPTHIDTCEACRKAKLRIELNGKAIMMMQDGQDPFESLTAIVIALQAAKGTIDEMGICEFGPKTDELFKEIEEFTQGMIFSIMDANHEGENVEAND